MVVNEISKERKSLSRSMRDVDSAIGKLDDVLVVVVLIIAIFVMISFLNTNFATTLATAGTALLSLSFIFAVTCQEVLASILFLFYKVPPFPCSPCVHPLPVLLQRFPLCLLEQW